VGHNAPPLLGESVMGLDMYLNAERYLYSFDDKESTLGKEIAKVVGLSVDSAQNGTPFINRFGFQVGYWRKQNAVHQWFVDNVQGGEDNCAKYEVNIDQLKELRGTCEDILLNCEKKWNKVKASITNDMKSYDELPVKERKIYSQISEWCDEHLPTTSGFFFGGTDYDEWYFQGLKDTITIIDRCEKLSEENASWYFEYNSSW
jgi:hypothetical protein